MVPTVMDLGGKYAERNQQRRKKIADVLEGKIEKKENKSLQHRDSEMQTQTLNSKGGLEGGRARDELGRQH